MADVPHAYPPDLNDREIQGILAALDSYDLEISNINAFMLHAEGDTWHPSWIEPDPSLRQRRVLHTLNSIDLAARLGAKTLSTEPGGPLQGMAPSRALEIFIEGLKRIEERARARGVLVLIEPEPGLLVENSIQFRELLEHLDPEVFGLNFDIGHFFCIGEDPAHLVRRMASVSHHFHLEDIAANREHRHLMPGEGAIDIHRVLDTLSDTGYEGFVTVELYPYEDRPVETAKRAFAYLQEWLRGRGANGREVS
jgi:sugar phosphate isomerase/epimerase